MKKRIITLLMCAIMIIAGALTAFAAEDGEVTKEGVRISIKTSQEKYNPGDKVEITVSVKNSNTYDVSNVTIKYPNLPAEIEFDQDTMVKKIARLEAGEFKQFVVTGTVSADAPVKEGTSDEGKSSSGVIIGIIIGGVALLAVIIVVVIVIVVKKKGKNTVAMLLVVALGAGSIASLNIMDVNAEVSEETMVENSDYKRVSVHDPSIVKDGDTYYVFGSHMAWAKSEDLINWQEFKMNINTEYNTLFGDIWKNYCSTPQNANLSGNLWAPDVIWNETMGKWCMYMSVNGNNWQSAIVLLTADNIEGPYTYVDEVVFSGFMEGENKGVNAARAAYSDVYKVLGENADLKRYSSAAQSMINAIDPNVQYDEEGNLWMTYGSWSAGIFQLKLDNATGLRDYNYTYETQTGKSDAYLGYKISGGHYNSGEGPYILKAGDYYYLFISLGNLETSGGYNMRVYRSESIHGPFVDQNGNEAILKAWDSQIGYQSMESTAKYNTKKGIRLFCSYAMYGISQIQAAQGHNSAFVDDDGKIYLVYHTRFAGSSEGHQVRVHQLFINEDGWLVAAPYEYGNETLSTTGYSEEDICGTYEFVKHNPSYVYHYNNGNQLGIVGNTAESVFSICSKTINIGGNDVSFKVRFDFSKAAGESVTLEKDGTISGDYTGTWKVTDGANVIITIDDVEYKGVFLKQQNELTTRDVTMTFTVLGDNVTVWGVKPLE